MDTRTFRHEIEWYDYSYANGKICICPKAAEGACTLYFFSQEKIEELIHKHKLNPFLKPIYQRALEIILQGEKNHEIKEIKFR